MVKKRFETFRLNKCYEKYNVEIDKVLSKGDGFLQKLETLFPIALEDYSNIQYCQEEYSSILVASSYLEDVPGKLEFFGVVAKDERFVLITFEDAFSLIERDTEEFKIVAINPNMNRVAKMLYGSSIGDVMSEMSSWFVDHLLDQHTNVYKKNSGESYYELKLTKDEIEASSDWLDSMFQEEIFIGFKLYLNIENPAVTDIEQVKRKIALIKLYDLIYVIEQSKNDILGYGFKESPVIDRDRTTYELLLDKLDKDKEGNNMLTLISNKISMEDATYDVLKLAYDNCYIASFQRVIESSLIEILYVLLNEDVNIPAYDIIKRYQSTTESLQSIKERFQDALKVEPILVDNTLLSDWQYHYCGDVFIIQKHRREFLVYDNICNKCNKYTKALMTKCKLTSKDVLHMLIELNGVDAPLILKYEASVIALAQQLNLYKNSKVPNPYLNYFKMNKNSVKDVLGQWS